ncbi:MAG: NAD(P)/FAD-dependent oxidoreductase, partial [Planctomycetota bacterium]|nr:NAD(P)/FAD-dependent oxidoreductase [Planctomycetota bacterium]
KHGKIYQGDLTQENDPDPYLVLPHEKIEQALLQYALSTGKTTLIRPGKVVDVLTEADTITGVQYQCSEGLKQARGRLVVACDGYRSVIRERLKIEAKAKFYDHAYLGLEADRPPGYQDAMRIHLHKDGGVLLMPRPDRIGLGILVEPKSSAHWLQMNDKELNAQLTTRVPILAEVKIHRQGSHVYDLARAHAAKYVGHGAVIIGDAAHVTNPTAGQGMTMALGDAGALADLIGPARNLNPILKEFEALQWPTNEKIIRNSHILAKLYSLRGKRWDWVKKQFIRALANPFSQSLVNPIVRRFLVNKKQIKAHPPKPSPLPLEMTAKGIHP